ncbi:hypothetical protein HV012_12470 [Escherichia fergusonii]|uniref:hypothetical protein n=1 Tax=Escherichia fergusonii TaxID=564 RepID=UPI0015E94626|nr:hypothetical protein [Escherichia fergusonii]QMB01762.1 hypothetical protein HV012_12470 [Escherichia fergusonii]QMB10730.1 hypothetical protein HV010_12460 [Escherichia fergusonii]QMC64629.1 hypothetical protein HVZ69_12715 [Escherichia fergusonii]
MIRTLVIDFAKASKEPRYQFNADILGGSLLKVAFNDALASPWVSTINTLPHEYQLVLISDGHGFEAASYIAGHFHVDDCVYPVSSIDWWMPIPELPEREES